MQRPSSNLVQALEIFKNKHLFSREVELREEIYRLELQENMFKKRKQLASETSLKSWTNDEFIKDIDILIEKFKEKSKNLGSKSAEYDYNKNTDIINSFDKQIDYYNLKEKEIQKTKKEHETKDVQLKNESIRNKIQGDTSGDTEGLNKTLNDKRNKINTEKQKTIEISE